MVNLNWGKGRVPPGPYFCSWRHILKCPEKKSGVKKILLPTKCRFRAVMSGFWHNKNHFFVGNSLMSIYTDCHSQKVSVCWLILHRFATCRTFDKTKTRISGPIFGWGIHQKHPICISKVHTNDLNNSPFIHTKFPYKICGSFWETDRCFHRRKSVFAV